MTTLARIATLSLLVVGVACSESAPPEAQAPAPEAEPPPAVATAPEAAEPSSAPAPEATRQLFWGDTHLHTNYSPDAFFFGNTTGSPDVAYRYARGLPVTHPYHGARVQIGTPLDFLVIADHAEMMGVPLGIAAGVPLVAQTENGRRIGGMIQEGKGEEAFLEFVGRINENEAYPDLDTPEIKRSAWEAHTEVTERNNEPGRFTALIGWEWTSTPGGKNLHRVVFMPEGRDKALQFVPYNSFDSAKPEDLWSWLEATSQEVGSDFVSIPHNSNISGGLMFDEVDSEGRPITADYARKRMRWEGIAEITQIKGDSETLGLLSTNDEFAEFETFSHLIDADALASGAEGPPPDAGDYVRTALMRGLAIEAGTGVNPYKFGLIGSSDSHTALASAEEDEFHGKTAFDSTPENTFGEFLGIEGFGADMSAAGLAAVWAEENTRESLFAAFKRKEVYASTGPRIALRFFGGFGFDPADAASPDLASTGYAKGVPMGGDLAEAPAGAAPSFLVHAAKDPVGGNLDRIQIVKGWLDAKGESHEQVHDVALSDGRKAGADGKVPPVGNTVDLATGLTANTIGDAQLAVAWSDPAFDPAQRAFYYARVLQIPTARHTLLDGNALGLDPAETGYPPTIQERAYSSPIWYTPSE
jgi:hypothetical protein